MKCISIKYIMMQTIKKIKRRQNFKCICASTSSVFSNWRVSVIKLPSPLPLSPPSKFSTSGILFWDSFDCVLSCKLSPLLSVVVIVCVVLLLRDCWGSFCLRVWVRWLSFKLFASRVLFLILVILPLLGSCKVVEFTSFVVGRFVWEVLDSFTLSVVVWFWEELTFPWPSISWLSDTVRFVLFVSSRGSSTVELDMILSLELRLVWELPSITGPSAPLPSALTFDVFPVSSDLADALRCPLPLLLEFWLLETGVLWDWLLIFKGKVDSGFIGDEDGFEVVVKTLEGWEDTSDIASELVIDKEDEFVVDVLLVLTWRLTLSLMNVRCYQIFSLFSVVVTTCFFNFNLV